MAEPEIWERVFAIADLISGEQMAGFSGGGEGNSNSDLRWNGRNPDGEENTYRR